MILNYQDSGPVNPQNHIPAVILADKEQNFSYNMSALKNQLKKNNIYYKETNIDNLMDLIDNQEGSPMFIINNESLKDNQIPKQLHSAHHKIYCYPQHSKAFNSLKSVNQVLQKIIYSSPRKPVNKRYDNNIRMKSVNKINDNQKYSIVLLYSGNSVSQEYNHLVRELRNSEHIRQIKKENQISNYFNGESRIDKCLLVTEVDTVKGIQNLLSEAHYRKKVDLAVFGIKKEAKLSYNNIVLATDESHDIIQYLKSKGLNIPRTGPHPNQAFNYNRQDQIIQRNQPTQLIGSPIQKNRDRLETQSANSLHVGHSHTKKNDQTNQRIINDIPFAGLMMNQQKDKQSQIQSNSEYSKSKKVKKVKKVNKKTEKSQIQSPLKVSKIDSSAVKTPLNKNQPENGFILSNNDPVIKTTYVQKKPIMNWDIFVPGGQKNYIINSSRQNPSLSSVGRPNKSENYSADFPQDSQGSIKQSDNKNNSNLNYGTIAEVSDEYRGSNRQSFIGVEKNLPFEYLNENNNILEEQKPNNNNIAAAAIISNRSMPQNNRNSIKDDMQATNSQKHGSQQAFGEKMKDQYDRAKYQLNQLNNQRNNQQYNKNTEINNIKISPPSKVINKSYYQGPQTYYQDQSKKSISNQYIAAQKQPENYKKFERQQHYNYKVPDETSREKQRRIIEHKNVEPAQYVSSMKNVSGTSLYSGGAQIQNGKNYVENKVVNNREPVNIQKKSYPYQNQTKYVTNNNKYPSQSYQNKYIDTRYANQPRKSYNYQPKNIPPTTNNINNNYNQNYKIVTPTTTTTNNNINTYQKKQPTRIQDKYNYTQPYTRIQKTTKDPTTEIREVRPKSPIYTNNYNNNYNYNSNNNYNNNANFNSNSNSNLDKSLNNTKSRILDAKSVDLQKYQRVVDENGRVMYITKNSKSVNKSPETKEIRAEQNNVRSPTQYQSKYNNNRNYITTTTTTNRPSVYEIKAQPQKNNYSPNNRIVANYQKLQYPSDYNKIMYTDTTNRQINRTYKQDPPQNRYTSENKYTYQNKYTPQNKYTSPNKYTIQNRYTPTAVSQQKNIDSKYNKNMDGVRVYTKAEYQKKLLNDSNATGGSRKEVVSASEKYLNDQTNRQVSKQKDQRYSHNYINPINTYKKSVDYPSANTINSGATIEINQQANYKINSYSANNNLKEQSTARISNFNSQEKLGGQTNIKKQVKPNSQNRYIKSQTHQTRNSRYEQPHSNSNNNIGQIIKKNTDHQLPPRTNYMDRNHGNIGYESRSSSNSSGIIRKFNNISEYDRKVIRENSSIKQNKESSDNQNKLYQNSHTDKQTDNQINQQKEGLQVIYVDSKHKDMKSFIDTNFPNKYNLRFFKDVEELTEDREAIILLHPDVDYIGQNLPVRQFESVYMLGKTSKVPSGTIRIQHEDLKYIL